MGCLSGKGTVGQVMSEAEVKPSRASGIQVIARAAAILRVLRDSETGLSLGQIARQVGLPRSTVQRIVGALQEERLVIAASAEGVAYIPSICLLPRLYVRGSFRCR